MNCHILVIAKKSGQKYVFLVERGCYSEALLRFGRFASDPDLDFNWYDAAILTHKLKKLMSI